MYPLVDQVLKENALSLTLGRRKVLGFFLDAEYALAYADIDKELKDRISRITVYRTLRSFVDVGLIHLIPTTNNSIKYALTKQVQHRKALQQNHVHFVCTNCNKTTCLDHTTVPHVKLPKPYKAEINEMLITGRCVNCR